MALPIPKVEIGFDLQGANAPLFTLDDASRGVLDNTEFTLSGTIFYDVTESVTSVSIQRGKNREFGQYNPGLANVVFNNNNRTFDPEYEASPFYGQIIPKRAIRISSGGRFIFTGVVDDWNLAYDVSGYSQASAACSDGFSNFNSQTLTPTTSTAETSGERVNRILNDALVNWPTAKRNIENGRSTFGADVIGDDANALTYLQQIEESEAGDLFIGKAGDLIFKDRTATSSDDFLTFADDDTGIGYQTMQVVYGSELLYNEISITNFLETTVTVTDTASVNDYGNLNLTNGISLVASTEELSNIALLLASRYSQPEYRFDAISVILDKFDTSTQNQMLDLELGDVVEIKFTPNKIPPAISKFAAISNVKHEVTPTSHIVTFGFRTIEKSAWTLSDAVFGRLSSNNILSF